MSLALTTTSYLSQFAESLSEQDLGVLLAPPLGRVEQTGAVCLPCLDLEIVQVHFFLQLEVESQERENESQNW